MAHTHCAEELNTHRKATVAAVWALCAGLRAGVEAVHLSRAFRRHWAACGAVAVWDSHDAATLAIQNIQSQEPRFRALLGRSILVLG